MPSTLPNDDVYWPGCCLPRLFLKNEHTIYILAFPELRCLIISCHFSKHTLWLPPLPTATKNEVCYVEIFIFIAQRVTLTLSPNGWRHEEDDVPWISWSLLLVYYFYAFTRSSHYRIYTPEALAHISLHHQFPASARKCFSEVTHFTTRILWFIMLLWKREWRVDISCELYLKTASVY